MQRRAQLIFVGAILAPVIATAMMVAPKQFPDVRQNDWFKRGVDFAVLNDLMNGYENGYFGPNDSVTRAQLATVFMRYNVREQQKEEELLQMLRQIICFNKNNFLSVANVDEELRSTYEAAIQRLCNAPINVKDRLGGNCNWEFNMESGAYETPQEGCFINY